MITPENIEPNPKNPIIVSFFRNIGYAEQVGSGVRNLFKYSKFYSGKEPEFIEDDIFRIKIVITSDTPKPFYNDDGILIMNIYDFLLLADSLKW